MNNDKKANLVNQTNMRCTALRIKRGFEAALRNKAMMHTLIAYIYCRFERWR